MRKHAAAFFAVFCLLAFLVPANHVRAADTGDAIVITDRAGLEAIADAPDARYVLAADIDMGDTDWQPIPFSGTLDGAGHILYNLTVTEADPEPATSVDGNRKGYDTVFAALFSRTRGAVIQNLHLLGAEISVSTPQSCYAAGLVGYAEDTSITGCSVGGRVTLEVGGPICGIGGIMGFGWGTVTGCGANVTLTLVDTNEAAPCEEFLGGILASGYADIEDCTVALSGYASVHGYVHNGGVVGMYYVHTADTGHSGYVRRNTVDAEITFFEDVRSRRAYCAPVIGEQMHWVLEIEDNTVQNFVRDERDDYTTPLLPEMCASPAYSQQVAPPGCDSFGYTTHTCAGCGHSYTDGYTPPAHQPGEWETLSAPTPEAPGRRVRHCTLCGAPADEAEDAFVPVEALLLSETTLTLEQNGTARLTATVQPTGATLGEFTFTSSNELVATVDEQGNITATGPGSALITCATPDGAVTAGCTVEVRAPFPLWLLAAAMVLALAVFAVVLALVLRQRRISREKRRENRRTYYRR